MFLHVSDSDRDSGADSVPLLHIPGRSGQVSQLHVAGLQLAHHQEHVVVHQTRGEDQSHGAPAQPLL